MEENGGAFHLQARLRQAIQNRQNRPGSPKNQKSHFGNPSFFLSCGLWLPVFFRNPFCWIPKFLWIPWDFLRGEGDYVVDSTMVGARSEEGTRGHKGNSGNSTKGTEGSGKIDDLGLLVVPQGMEKETDIQQKLCKTFAMQIRKKIFWFAEEFEFKLSLEVS